LTSLASTPNSEAVSATRISLMASSSRFIFFSGQGSETYNHLPCLYYFLQKHYTSKDTNVFYSDSKTDLKLQHNCI
jgi:hypothetical protein